MSLTKLFSLIFMSTYIVVNASWSIAAQNAPSKNDKTKTTIENLPLDELATLVDAYVQIKKSYVKELTDKEILDNAIQGMLKNLDQHSIYYTAKDFAAAEQSARGEYAGIGITAEHTKEGIFVRKILAKSPAAKSGLKLNDNIIAIDGLSTIGLTTEQGSDLMRGAANSKLLLEIMSMDGQISSISLSRQIIQISSVSKQLLESNIGYARIDEFQVRSAKDLSVAIAKLENMNGSPLKGFILDLRNNPGGILDAAVAISDLFLHKGTIVSIKGRIENSNQSYSATSGDILAGRPMTILINRNSASASEIVAGALQDLKRATIIGKQSFGKGSVQTIFPIHSGGAVKMTTSLYYTPNNRSIQDFGITPDIEVNLSVESNDSEAENLRKDLGYNKDNQVIAAIKFLQTQ